MIDVTTGTTTVVVVNTKSLTDLQLAVMKVLWDRGESAPSDVQAAMSESGKTLAPTTVATLLQRLKQSGWAKSRKNGRQLLYRAKLEERDAANGALYHVLRSFFGGKVSALTAQLLGSEQLDAEELAQLRALIDKKGPCNGG